MLKGFGISVGRSSVAQKLMMVVGFCIALTCLIAGVGLYQMHKIGAEIKTISQGAVPLDHAVSELTVDEAEETALVDRILRIAGVRKDKAGNLHDLEAQAQALAKRTDEVVAAGEKEARTALAHAGDDARAKAEFES